jgi:hypothetical protein
MNSNFHFCEFSIDVQFNKPVSIPSRNAIMALDVRQNSWPMFMSNALALETRLLFILLNAIRMQTDLCNGCANYLRNAEGPDLQW